jgi:hypothetical protein
MRHLSCTAAWRGASIRLLRLVKGVAPRPAVVTEAPPPTRSGLLSTFKADVDHRNRGHQRSRQNAMLLSGELGQGVSCWSVEERMANQTSPAARGPVRNPGAVVRSCILLSCAVLGCTPDDRPLLFSHITEQGPRSGGLVQERFGKLYRIIDVDVRKHRYTPPRYLTGLDRPELAYGTDPHPCLPQSAWILFVVAADGVVISPQVVETSPTLSSELAIERANKMRFQPATLDGNPIPAVADFHLAFNCPTVPGHRP